MLESTAGVARSRTCWSASIPSGEHLVGAPTAGTDGLLSVTDMARGTGFAGSSLVCVTGTAWSYSFKLGGTGTQEPSPLVPQSSLVCVTGTAWSYSSKLTGTLPPLAADQTVGVVTLTLDSSDKVPGSSTIETGVTTLADSSAGWGGSLSLAALLAIMLIGTVRCTVLRQTAK